MVTIRIGALGPDGRVMLGYAWHPDGNVSNEIFITLPTWEANLRALGLKDLPSQPGTHHVSAATAQLCRQRCRDYLSGSSSADGRSEDVPGMLPGIAEQVERHRRMAQWLATWLDGATVIQIEE